MFDWSDLGAALALVLVVEGLLPLLSPRRFREALIAAMQMSDRTLRILGFTSMVAGVLLLYSVR